MISLDEFYSPISDHYEGGLYSPSMACDSTVYPLIVGKFVKSVNALGSVLCLYLLPDSVDLLSWVLRRDLFQLANARLSLDDSLCHFTGSLTAMNIYRFGFAYWNVDHGAFIEPFAHMQLEGYG
ncbi:hypothetical protein R1flu_026828 [Riccia fluitans]|uniref:Uncharacterized protein n=1 Tax=Riccia fluitans TaxID=41844 RepID=A0ABD1XH08_9MARC